MFFRRDALHVFRRLQHSAPEAQLVFWGDESDLVCWGNVLIVRCFAAQERPALYVEAVPTLGKAWHEWILPLPGIPWQDVYKIYQWVTQGSSSTTVCDLRWISSTAWNHVASLGWRSWHVMTVGIGLDFGWYFVIHIVHILCIVMYLVKADESNKAWENAWKLMEVYWRLYSEPSQNRTESKVFRFQDHPSEVGKRQRMAQRISLETSLWTDDIHWCPCVSCTVNPASLQGALTQGVSVIEGNRIVGQAQERNKQIHLQSLTNIYKQYQIHKMDAAYICGPERMLSHFRSAKIVFCNAVMECEELKWEVRGNSFKQLTVECNMISNNVRHIYYILW